MRLTWGINFTGHYDPDLAICPAEQARGLGDVGDEHGWGGNAPTNGRLPDQREVDETIDSLKAIDADLLWRAAHPEDLGW